MLLLGNALKCLDRAEPLSTLLTHPGLAIVQDEIPTHVHAFYCSESSEYVFAQNAATATIYLFPLPIEIVLTASLCASFGNLSNAIMK